MINSFLFVIANIGWDGIREDVNLAKYAVEALCTIIAGIFGLVTAVKIHNRWQLKETMVTYDVAMWMFGAMFFLIGKFAINAIF